MSKCLKCPYDKELQSEKIDSHLYDWHRYARPNQLPPESSWLVWLILAGRGFGKTRTGAETVRQWAMQGKYKRIALVSHTEADGRAVMVEGQSGLLNVSPPWEKVVYESSRRRLTWPNGAIATLYSADHYEQLRGPQFDAAWVDELAKFRYAQETWDQLMMGLRLGEDPKVIITTTPKPLELLKKLMTSPECYITKGSSYDNAANLSPVFIDMLKRQYEGRPLGNQEIHADIVENTIGALWNYDHIHYRSAPSELRRIVIAIDPAVSTHTESAETGIVVVGKDHHHQGYVLADLSCKNTPTAWAKQAIAAYYDYKADRIVAEVNNGGNLVESLLKAIDPQVSYKPVHASRGKITRAEPIAALYHEKKIFHTQPFTQLEQQMTQFVPDTSRVSPDRLDALVWGMTELLLETEASFQPKSWIL